MRGSTAGAAPSPNRQSGTTRSIAMARYTAEFLDALRRRYEDTDEPLRLVTAEFGIGKTTLQDLVLKHGWQKRSRRTRAVPAAAQIIEDMIALANRPVASQESSATNSAHLPLQGGEPAPDLIGGRRANGPPRSAARWQAPRVAWGPTADVETPTPTLPLAGGGSERPCPPTTDSRDAALDGIEAFLIGRLEAE